MKTEEVISYNIDLNKASQQVSSLEKETRRLDEQQKQLNKDFANGKISAEEYSKATAKTTDQLKNVQKQAKSLVSGLSSQLGEFGSLVRGIFSGPGGIAASIIGGLKLAYDYFEQRQKKAEENLEKIRSFRLYSGADYSKETDVNKLQKSLLEQEKVLEGWNKQLKDLRSSYERIKTASQSIRLSSSEREKLEQKLVNLQSDIENAQKQQEASSSKVEEIQGRINSLKEDELRKQRERAELESKQAKEIEDNLKKQQDLKIKIENEINDLKIKNEKNEQQRQIKQIRENERRTLQAIEAIRKVANTENKALLDQWEKLVTASANAQVRAVTDPQYVDALDRSVKRLASFMKEYILTKATTFETFGKSDAELAEQFVKQQNTWIKTIEDYENYLKQLFTKAFEPPKVESFNWEEFLETEKLRKHITEIQYVQNQEYVAAQRLTDEENKLKEAEDERFKNKKRQIEFVEQAEYDRLMNLRELQIQATAELENLTEEEHRNKFGSLYVDGVFTPYNSEDFEKYLAKETEKYGEIMVAAEDEHNLIRYTQEVNFQNKRELLELQTAEKIKQIQKDMLVSNFNAYSQFFDGVSGIFNGLADLQDENSQKQIKLQKAAIYLGMASALAQGIANATQAGWPAMLATIPTTIATLIADFAQVKKLKSQSGYARGGLISGEGSGTSDSIQTRVSNGESIINSRATSLYAPLLSAINQSTGGAPIVSAANNSTLARELALAVAAMPNPVVTVEDIAVGQNRTKYVRTISKL